MQKNWFKRMLYSYLPVFFVVSLSLLFLTYLALNEISRQSAQNANELLSQSILQQIDNTLLDIDKLMQQQLLDNDIIRNFFKITSSPQERQPIDYLAASELYEMMNHHEMISSVYLYRMSDMTVVTPSAFNELEDFGDGPFIAKNVNSLTPFKWTSPRPYRSRLDDAFTNVVTLVKYGDLAHGSLMVVNVNVDNLTDIIRSMAQSNINYVELVDQNGEVITSNIASRKEDLDNRSEFSYVYSSYTGWAVQSGIFQSGVFGWVSSLFYIWIAFGIFVVLAGILWLVYVTYRNYKPIQGIMNRISSYSNSEESFVQDHDKGDELQHIGNAIDYLFETSSQLQEQNKENLSYRKRQVFLNLIDGNVSKKSNWKSELELLGIHIHQNQNYVMTIIEIDHYATFSERYHREDQSLLKYILISVALEIAENIEVSAWAEWINERQLGVMYIFYDHDRSEYSAELHKASETLREWVEKNLSYTVTIGIGRFVEQLDQLVTSKESAVHALSYKSSIGINQLISAEQLSPLPQGDIYKHLNQIRRISQLYRTGDAKWKDDLTQLFHDMNQKWYTRDQLYELQNHLMYNLEREMKDHSAEIKAMWENNAMTRLRKAQAEIETKQEITERIISILEEIFIEINSRQGKKSNFELVHDVKYYIQDHYNDPNLSLDHLSDEFGLGSSYLSRLFKEAFGVTFSEYVLQIRMNEAKKRLEQSNDTVQDIAVAVGYVRSLTFIRAFKKFTGQTPGNYRNLLLDREREEDQ